MDRLGVPMAIGLLACAALTWNGGRGGGALRASDGSGPARSASNLAAAGSFPLGTLRGSGAHAGGTPAPVDAKKDKEKEYRVKAALLFNFAKYTTWPKSAFASDKDPIVILIVGNDPFGAILDKTLSKNKVKGRTFKIVRTKTVPTKVSAHVVFARGLSTADRTKLFKVTAKSHAVVVGDSLEFAEKGGMVGFYTEKGKVRFAVNEERHSKSPTTLSAQLLKLAKVLRTKKGTSL